MACMWEVLGNKQTDRYIIWHRHCDAIFVTPEADHPKIKMISERTSQIPGECKTYNLYKSYTVTCPPTFWTSNFITYLFAPAI